MQRYLNSIIYFLLKTYFQLLWNSTFYMSVCLFINLGFWSCLSDSMFQIGIRKYNSFKKKIMDR